MKCPERYLILQGTTRRPILNIDNQIKGEFNELIEFQGFGECYKENCAAWDKENQVCRKVGE